VAIDAARRDLRKKRGSATRTNAAVLDRVAGNTPGPDEQAEQRELRERVLAALRSLPDEYRQPLTLRYIAGAEYDTISTELGLTNGSLRGLLYRGLKMLRAKLAGTLGDESDKPDNTPHPRPLSPRGEGRGVKG
jgi:RNA polymerase sigma-70 factor (ECF subfamily)